MPILAGQGNLQQLGPLAQVKIFIPEDLQDLLEKHEKNIPKPVDAMAMIDTGATSSVIQEGMAKKLGLSPVGQQPISTPTTEKQMCYVYQVRIVFPNNSIASLLAIEAPLQNQHIQCLLGRDLLSRSVFVYTGITNSFSLSF